MPKNIHKVLSVLIFAVILFLFCYFRLKPIYFQTVGYTYDQGRDFLQAARIVLDKKITLIGPTTGIQGVFHGAWWYYLIVIPYIIFSGSPIGFYYFNFIIQLLSFLLLAYFLNKYFGSVVALIISALVATSPYFIFTSLFVGNNIMVLPIFLLFLLANFHLEQQDLKRPVMAAFVVGLLLGFIFEFELAFGLFILPIYFILAFLIKKLRDFFSKKTNFLALFGGLIIPFLPRLLFELRHGFLQTQTFLHSFVAKNDQNPNSFSGAMRDRLSLFFDYYRSLFSGEVFFVITTALLFLYAFLLVSGMNKKIRFSFIFPMFLLMLLFIFASFYKENFFWGNYFEGIQYLFLLLIALIFCIKFAPIEKFLQGTKICLLLIFIVGSVSGISADIKVPSEKTGVLILHEKILNYIAAQEKRDEDYCLKIYTPPVIPYTYDYLLLHNKQVKRAPIPQKDWVKNRCWFIIEPDDYKERRDKWLKDNIHPSAKLISETDFTGTKVAHYEKKSE